ncbi:hypothetical protein AGMMS49944_17420 [Spirochaetia bacterium]|nr:hypothetical protein AGMMS49944_17420 [Spirochaetia bacterium]
MKETPCIFNDDDRVIQQDIVEMRGFALPFHKWNNRSSFFAINPVNHIGDNRKNENIAVMKNFLFESDTLTLEEQKALLKDRLDIISMATYSGNKSIHLIIQVMDYPKTIEEYHYLWKLLKDTYFPYADNQCKDCLRLSRTPNAIRNDTNKKQVLIWNTLQPLNIIWKPLYNKIQEMKNIALTYRKTTPIVRNDSLSYEAECILNGDYPKGERDAIINKGIPYLFFNGFSLEEILLNNQNTRNNPKTIKNYYDKLVCYYAKI